MNKYIYLILFILIALTPNILFAVDASLSKKAENPFYDCLFDSAELNKHCTKLPNKLPVKVQISLHLLDILEINQIEGTWTVRSFLYSQWRDTRLAFNPKDFGGLHKLSYKDDLADDQMLRMWHPNLTITNQMYRREIENREISISKFGIVYYKEVFTAKIRTRLNFKKFPFDEHVVTIEVEPFSETQTLVRLVPAVRKNGNSSVAPDIWTANKFKVEFSNRPGARNQLSTDTGLWLDPDGSQSLRLLHLLVPSSSNFSLMTFSLGIKRNYFNFLTTKLLILYVFALILWINAGFSGGEESLRWPWEVFLGIIFFSLEAQDELPPLPYLTLYNLLVNELYAYVFIDFVAWVISTRLKIDENHSPRILLQRIQIWFIGPAFILAWAATISLYIKYM